MKLLLFAAALAFLGACSSGGGGGCDSGSPDKGAPAGQSTSLPGGASSRGGTNETVSFQGLGRKAAGQPAPAGAAGRTAAAAAALGGSNGASAAASGGAQSVICGGFPNLAPDCKTDPAFAAVQKKCCPAGTVDQCQAIPGGARLLGHGCTVPASGPVTSAAQ